MVKSLQISWKILRESNFIFIITIVIYYYYSYAAPPSLWTPYTYISVFLEHKWPRCLLNLLCLIQQLFPFCSVIYSIVIRTIWMKSKAQAVIISSCPGESQPCYSIPADPHKPGSAWTCSATLGLHHCSGNGVSVFVHSWLISTLFSFFDTKFSLETQ